MPYLNTTKLLNMMASISCEGIEINHEGENCMEIVSFLIYYRYILLVFFWVQQYFLVLLSIFAFLKCFDVFACFI